MTRFGKDFWLILLHLENLRCSETCECIIAGDLNEILFAEAGANIIALRGGALIVP